MLVCWNIGLLERWDFRVLGRGNPETLECRNSETLECRKSCMSECWNVETSERSDVGLRGRRAAAPLERRNVRTLGRVARAAAGRAGSTRRLLWWLILVLSWPWKPLKLVVSGPKSVGQQSRCFRFFAQWALQVPLWTAIRGPQ